MKKIILLLLSAFILIVAFRSKAKINITGNVKDENANPVAAIIKGGNDTTTTDVNGNYSIAINENEGYIIFSGVGYKTQKIKNMSSAASTESMDRTCTTPACPRRCCRVWRGRRRDRRSPCRR